MAEPSQLRIARKKKNLTQVQVAKHLGVAQSVIVKWETEKTEPTMRIGLKLAELVGTPPEQLWPDERRETS